MEERFDFLLQTLRCLSCQGQSLATSDAPIAQAMKAWIHKKIMEGHSNATIVESLTSIYGVEIMLAPPFNAQWLLFWFFPLGILVSSGVVLLLFLRKRGAGQ